MHRSPLASLPKSERCTAIGVSHCSWRDLGCFYAQLQRRRISITPARGHSLFKCTTRIKVEIFRLAEKCVIKEANTYFSLVRPTCDSWRCIKEGMHGRLECVMVRWYHIGSSMPFLLPPLSNLLLPIDKARNGSATVSPTGVHLVPMPRHQFLSFEPSHGMDSCSLGDSSTP